MREVERGLGISECVLHFGILLVLLVPVSPGGHAIVSGVRLYQVDIYRDRLAIDSIQSHLVGPSLRAVTPAFLGRSIGHLRVTSRLGLLCSFGSVVETIRLRAPCTACTCAHNRQLRRESMPRRKAA